MLRHVRCCVALTRCLAVLLVDQGRVPKIIGTPSFPLQASLLETAAVACFRPMCCSMQRCALEH
eukprot:10484510-Alexandrium_andersonii.AAC.1